MYLGDRKLSKYCFNELHSSISRWSKKNLSNNTCIKSSVNPAIIYAAKKCGVKEIYKTGGPQSIAALAYGTKTFEKVDKIVGPGNAYVASAKKEVFGDVGIDMVAGPSEVSIVADK